MRNLLNNTDIATVFLDRELNIQRFTDQAKRLVTLRDTDVGRLLSELASNLKCDGVVSNCREVIRTLAQRKSKGERLDQLGSAQWDLPELRRLLKEIIPTQTTIENFEVTAELSKIGKRSFVVNARRLDRQRGLPEMILLAIEEE